MSPKVTPKDFFLWAGAMFAIYGSVIAFITLLFQYINHAYPDPLSYAYEAFGAPYSGPMRFAMASLIVLVPVAMILMRIIRKDIATVPEKSELWVRRWALVLTVFVAGFAVVGNAITLVNYFLGGDLTMRFGLKVLVLFLVAGGAFLHFLADLRGYWKEFPSRAQMVSYGAAAVVLAAIVAGFFIMGSPGQVRLERFDSQKISTLEEIQWQIVSYWQQKQALPNSLSEIEDPISGWKVPTDPQGGEFTYQKTGDMSFRLCATFNVESRESAGSSMPIRAYGPIEGNWVHGAGEHCFDRSIDPERYPPFEKKPLPIPME